MKYSIVIPTHNNKKLLKNTLEALNYQEGYARNDYEVIVVDDGSSDDTFSYIKGINQNYDLFYFYLERCADSCRARTRNHGWKNAHGDIIVFIDSDIIVRRDFLFEMTRCFSNVQDIMVIGNRLLLNEEIQFEDIGTGKVFVDYQFDQTNFDLLDFRYFLYEITSFNAKAIMCPWMQVYSCNLAIPRQRLSLVGGFDENFKSWGLEDVELGYTLYKSGVQLVINHKLDVLHQFHGERSDLVIRKDLLRGYEENIDYFIAKHPEALKMDRRFIHKMLKGDLSVDKMLIEIPVPAVHLEYRDKAKLDAFKDMVEGFAACEDTRVIIHDFVEDTDLDIWVQLLKSKSIPKYYPESRRINQKDMLNYLKAERERQSLQA